jgi:hypothetical protein
MAPSQETSPSTYKATSRSALMSLFSTLEESSPDVPRHHQVRRFFFVSGGEICRFRRTSSSSGPDVYMLSFRMRTRTPRHHRLLPSFLFCLRNLGDRRRLHRSSPPMPLRRAPAHGAFSS